MNKFTEHTDVLVIGGGTAGTIAAIQAARAGVRTTMVEADGQLGGTTTSRGVHSIGYFHAWGRQVIAGIGWELVTRTKELDNDPFPDYINPPKPADGKTPPEGRPSHYTHLNRCLFPLIAEEAAVAAGVNLHFRELATDVRQDGDLWKVTCIGKGIKRVISAVELIDCTGDADLVGMLGFAREKGEPCQPGTLEFKLTGINVKNLEMAEIIEERYQAALRTGQLLENDYNRMHNHPFMQFLYSQGWNAQHVPGADSSTSASQSQANIAGRASLLRLLRFVKTLKGCENVRLEWASQDSAIRETYRIIGEMRVTREDYMRGRVFPDAVCWSIFFIDLHEDQGGITEFLPKGTVPTIPLGALIPRGSRNLLVAGRCLSSDRLANSALRIQPSCMAMGQAAGAAAALGVQLGKASRDVPMPALRLLLREHKALVPMTDDVPEGESAHATHPTSKRSA